MGYRDQLRGLAGLTNPAQRREALPGQHFVVDPNLLDRHLPSSRRNHRSCGVTHLINQLGGSGHHVDDLFLDLPQQRDGLRPRLLALRRVDRVEW